MNRFATALPILLLSSCGTPSTSQTTATFCLNNAAAISVLADRRAAGKLGPSTIALINHDIAITDPVCSGTGTLTDSAIAAFTELTALKGAN